MKLRTLWILILKIFGISFAYGAAIFLLFLLAIPFGKDPVSFSSFIIFIAEALLAYVFLFRTDQIIKWFRLEESISEEEINTNIESHKIFRIAIAVIGLSSFTDSVPEFIGNLSSGGNLKMALLSLLKVMIGFFLVVKSPEIEKWISDRQSE